MPGLSDLLRNPRRLQQFASTPGNYPAALDYASQGRVDRRAAPRASQSQDKETGVLETGEVIDKVKLPDGTYVRPATESGQLVKAPGKSNLYLDPANGEPYQADPSQPGGLRSAWASARRTAREGKEYATIPGVGEREIGPDPKAQEEVAKLARKREAENKRLAFAREKRPYNIDRVTGEPIALQSDEEWQKQKADKQAKLDEAARIKKLKAQADRLDLDAEEIKLNAPKIAKEDEDAYSAAEAALAEFAKGESLDTAAERLAAQPDTGDEAAAQAKAAAQSYMMVRDKVKPAKEAEAKVKELNLRALDLKKQMLDPEAWKAEKAATLPALDDASLAAEAKAQAEIITEQEADANDTITKIQEGRQKIADELDAFLTLRQQKEAVGITAQEMQALDDQQAQMEATLADYDDWHAEAAGEAQASLKAAGDRREVLAAAVQENERRDSAWARPLEGKWGEQQNAIMAAAEAAGLPKPSARNGESPSRALMAEAFGRLDKLGIKQPRFIGQADEPAGDRAAGKDLESLLAGLDKAEQQATTPGQKAAIAKEKAYWQAEAKDAMTAEEWKAQTGEPDLQYPQERAETMGKARDLYAWAKDNFHYTDDYRGMEDYGILDAEAKKRGIDPAQAREALQYFRQLDWSNEHRDPGTGKPLDETARLLPDGNVTVNPALLLDPEAYDAAVDATETTPEAKKRAKLMRADLAEPVAAEAIKNLRKNSDFSDWLDKNTSGTDLQRMEKFNAEMKEGGALNASLMKFFGSAASLPSGWLGAVAGLTGSDKALEYARYWQDRAQAYQTAAGEAGKGTNMAGRFIASVAGGVPSVMESMAVGGVAGRVLGSGAAALGTAAVDAAAQSGGGTFVEAVDAYMKQGLPEEEAKAKAAAPALASGLVTGVLTALGGGGVESLLRRDGQELAKAAIKRGLKSMIGREVAEGATEESFEEWSDQMLQGIIAQLSYDPNKSLEQVFTEATEAGLVGGVLGGGASGIRAFANRNAPTEGSQPYTPEAPAPSPEEGPAPAMPTQPRAAGQKDVGKIIEAFTPSGVPMPQAVNDTIKRTGRAPDQVAKAAASGLAKVAQGATLEGLDAREREALGFINKDGKIVPAPKTTPLVEIYKDKLVIRNEAAEWLDDEGQPALARQIKLDEAARKAQIDEAAAKPAKKKAGQAAPKAAESKSRDSEEVITSGSLPEVTGANPVPATISGATEAPKSSQTITGSNAEMAAEMPVPGAATEPSPGEAPTPPAPALQEAPEPEPAASGGLTTVKAYAEMTPAEYKAKRKQMSDPAIWSPAVAEFEHKGMIAHAIKNGLPFSQEAAKEYGIKPLTPDQAAQEPALTPAQADQMARAKAAYESAMRLANADPSPEIREKQKKAAGMKYAAAKRQITGKLTGKEAEAKAKREASNYEGKAVSVKGRNAVVTGTAFGKVKVKFDDGSKATVPAAEVQPPAQPAAVDEAAQEAATSPANALPEPSEAQKEAGNYQKGHVTISGLNISIENAAGTKRRPEWGELADHYGYVKGTIDNTGEHADVFIKPGTPEDYAGPVHVVTQIDPKTGKFDEFKTVIGYPDAASAEAAYRANYTADWKGFGGIQEMSLDEFKAGLADMTAREKAARQAEPAPASQEQASQPEAKSGLPPKTLPVYGINSKDVAKQYGLPDDFYIVQAAGNPSNPAAETIAVNPKYRTAELDAAEADLAKWQGVQGVNANTGRRMARERVEKAFSEVVNNAKAPASQPEAQPATPLARAQAALAAYQAKAVEAKKAATSQKDKNTANRQIVGAKHLAEQLAKLEGAVEYEIATAFKGAPIPSMMVIPAGKGGLLAINPAGLLDSITNNNLDAKAITKAIDKFIVHELIHKAALGRLSDARILDLYNALTPDAKEASRKLYLAQAGENPPPLDEFQAAHEWFAQLVEARMTGEISNQALIEASDDATFRDRLIALLRDFVAQLRDIAGLVKDKAMAEQIRAEADAVQAAAEAMAAKAGLDVQAKDKAAFYISEIRATNNGQSVFEVGVDKDGDGRSERELRRSFRTLAEAVAYGESYNIRNATPKPWALIGNTHVTRQEDANITIQGKPGAYEVVSGANTRKFSTIKAVRDYLDTRIFEGSSAYTKQIEALQADDAAEMRAEYESADIFTLKAEAKKAGIELDKKATKEEVIQALLSQAAQAKASPPAETAPETPADPNIGREWDSVYGRQRIVSRDDRGLGSYLAQTVGTDTVRRYGIRTIDDEIRRQEYALTPEYAAEQEERKARAERQAQAEKAQEEAKAKAAEQVNAYFDDIGLNPMQRGKLKAALDQLAARRSSGTGKVYSGPRYTVTEQMVADGFQPQIEQVPAIKEPTSIQWFRMSEFQQQEYERKSKAAGMKAEYRLALPDGSMFEVTKAEHDYAKWLAAKAGLEIQPKAKTPPTVSEQFKAVEPMATAIMEQLKGANADATKQSFEEWAAEFGVTDLAENPTLTEKLRATYNQKRAKAGLQVKAEEAGQAVSQPGQAVSSQPAAEQADPTLWADVSRFFASMSSDSARSAAIKDLKNGTATEDSNGYLIDLLENPNWTGNARSIAPKLIARLKATMGQPAAQAQPEPSPAQAAKLTPENAWNYMLSPSSKQGVATDYIDGLRVSLANANTLANDRAASTAVREKAAKDAVVLKGRIAAEETAWENIKSRYSNQELQQLAEAGEGSGIDYKQELQSLLSEYPNETTRPEWVKAQIDFLSKEAAQAVPTAGEAESHVLPPAQAAAVAKEEAMPEPAKQAAPFDAAAAKGQKKFLLAEVAAAVKAAPRRAEMTQEQKDTINLLESLPYELEKASSKAEAESVRLRFAATKADAKRLIGYVTIEVPGDGTFTILNEKGALAQFQKRADKFPVSAIRDDMPAKPTAQAPTAVPALKKPKTTADVVAAIYPMVSTDATRPALLKVKGDGTHLWATDGRTLVKVEHENGGGTGNDEVLYDEKGNASPQEDGGGRYDGNQVIPDDKDFTPYTLDTGRWFSLMSQARAVLKTLPGEEDSQYKSASLYRNPDGSLGVFASDVNRGDYAHNIQPEAKFLASYNPEYVQTILRVARNLGQEQVEMRIQDDVSPATFRAGPALFVLMPMRVNGAPAYSPQAQAARPAPPVTAQARPAATPSPEAQAPADAPASQEPAQAAGPAKVEPEDKPPVGYGDEPAPPPITAPGVRYNDIPLELARQAHRGTSFLPDVRARGEQRQYVAYMNDVWEAVSKQADTDEKKAIAKEQFETYRTRYLEKEKDLLRSRAGLLSAMITGPARFPVARAEKRSQAFHNKLKEFLAWDKKAKAAMLGKITPQSSGIISADDPDAPEQIQARIDELKARQEMMKKGNEVIRKNAGNKTAMASALRDLGVPEAEITRVLNPPQGYGLGWQSFTLTNNNANIRRNEERLEKVQKMRSRPARQATFEGGRVEENTEANRVQIFFDAIPSDDIRAKLKSNGFKWAPSQGAWQRQRTSAAVQAAESILGVKLAEKPAEPVQAEESEVGPETPTPLPADEGQAGPGLAMPPSQNLSENTQEINELLRTIPRRSPDDENWRKDHSESLLRWANNNGKIFDQKRFQETFGKFTATLGGAEHVVAKSPDGRALKMTVADSSMGWGHQHTLDRYLYNLVRSNIEFGDDIKIEGVFVKDGWPHIITSQPWVNGRSATQPEIDEYMKSKGFSKREGPRPGEYTTKDGILVADASPKNVMLNEAGEVRPIDVIFRVGRRDYVPFNLPRPGLAMPPAGQAVTPGQDGEYLAAVRAGDLAKAQSLVDGAAEAAGIYKGAAERLKKWAQENTDEETRSATFIEPSGETITFANVISDMAFITDQSAVEYVRWLQALPNLSETARDIVADMAYVARIPATVLNSNRGNIIPLSQRFNPASPSTLHMPPGDQSADLEAAARAAMGEAEAGQPATEAEDLAETARLMDEQQKQAEAEAKAREELRNDPANISAVEANGAMAGRNLSKQFTDPAARSFYQALTAAREMLGGPETVVFEEVRKWAARQLESDPAGAIAYATELADNKTIPGVEGQAVLAAVIEALNREVAMTGDKNQRLLLTRLGNYYLDLGTALAQGLGFRRDTVETPQDRWNKALRVVFGPAEKVRRRLRLAPTEAGKARRIAELEAQLARYQGSRRADIEAALAEAKRQETQESILEKEDAKNEKLKDQILGRMDLTERDLTLSPVDRYSLQTAILDLPQVREALDNYPDGRDIMRQAMRGFSDEHIAGSLGLNQDDVAKFIKDATNAIIRPAVKAEVQAGRGFGDMVKSGLQALARKVGLRMAAVSGPLGTMSPPLSAADLAKIEQEVDDILNFALQPASRRNKAGRLISKVIDTPGGKKVRVFVPFDPDDAASFYAFAREFSTAKSGFFDKLYEYWINWPLLGGPQTQVANITGNAAQLAWHYTGQRLAEAALNVAYRDPNSAQFSEFKHIATAFFRSMGPALDMARQSFLTEGDTVRHKYLNEPMEIEFKDGALDKLGAYRPAIGGKAGRLARLPGRLLRFADAFFKTAILHTEAAALAYRKAHAKAKAQGLTGANRATFIDTEMANDMNNQGSDVWVKAMDTAEELLFQDENAATDLVDAMLGGHRSVRDLEKLKAEAEAKGDYEAAARISNRIFWRSVWGKIMRLIFPFQRTPTNIIKAGLRKAGGAALAGAWHATRAGLLRYKDGKPFVESYTKAMQIKDLSESLLAGLGWLALSSMFEGDDDDEKKPILIVGNRPYSPGKTGEREAFLRQTGGANSMLFRDKDGKTIGTFNFSRYEPVATLLSAWVDGYRNFREVNRRRSQGEPDASYLTYIGSSLFASIEGKSFLQGVSGVMDTIRSFEERREPSTANWAAKQLINAAIPNIIKQPLRNWDDLVRETKTAGIGYTALPNPEVAPKTPFFQAQPKVTTTGEQIKKGYTGPARLLFQANAVVKPQPDALLLRANRLNPTAAWFPQPLQKDDFYVRAPGSKPGTPGYKSPITDPAKQRQFAELSGKLYAEAARQIEAKTPPAEKAKPTPGLIEAYKKARTEANAKARLMGGIRGLHKTATPAITTSNK